MEDQLLFVKVLLVEEKRFFNYKNRLTFFQGRVLFKKLMRKQKRNRAHFFDLFFRHLSLQYFTSSHTRAHFLRHVNGRAQTRQILPGRFCFCITDASLSNFNNG
jgi:hypothetical protein